MKRSILMSTLLVGAVVAILAAAGTQALFTDSQTASGDVNAGTINLYLLQNDDDDNGENEFVFESPALENLVPGQTATDNLRLRNDGTVTLTIAGLDFSSSTGADCDLVLGDDFVPDITGVTVGNTLLPGEFIDATVEVELLATAEDECQGAVFNLVLVVDVTS